MDHFAYRDGVMHAEDVSIAEIAAEVGTPFYCYSTATLERHYAVMSDALSGLDHLIAFALKSNGNLAVVATLARLGAGADIVSEGELRRALAAGVPPEKIVFSGVGKTERELTAALEAGIGQFNVESAPELEALSAIAASMNRVAPIAFRVNPDVDAGTHEKISTGRKGDKFGVPIDEAPSLYARAAALPGVAAIGVDVHIGSQLTTLEPFARAFERTAELTRALRAAGHAIERIDIGGGLGIPYRRSNAAPPLPFDYGAVVRSAFGDLGCRIVAEPGRLLVGNAGLLVGRVVYRKETSDRTFLILDAGMNDLMRPAMYGAWHDMAPVREPEAGAPLEPVDVVGPICESSDSFATERRLPAVGAGDLIAIRSAGAYAASMGSEYNARPLAPETLVSGDRFEVVRRRPSYDEMLRRDRLASWQHSAD